MKKMGIFASLVSDSAQNVIKTPLYSTLPINAELPNNVNYQIIDTIYFPETDNLGLQVASVALKGYGYMLDYKFEGEVLSKSNIIDFLNETEEQGESINIFGALMYLPKGAVKVYDTYDAQYVPVEQVRMRMWGFLAPIPKYMTTNSLGEFVRPSNVMGTTNVKMNWKSQSCRPRYRFWEWISPDYSNYLFKLKRSNNNRTAEISTSQTKMWLKSSVHNASIKYNTLASLNSIDELDRARIWIRRSAESSQSGGAPMMKEYPLIATATVFNLTGVWDIVVAPIAFSLSLLVWKPDLVFQFRGYDTHKLDQLCFHEMGHYSHGHKAGYQFWKDLVVAEATNIFNLNQDSYGDGTDPSSTKGKLIAICEGWGNFIEILFTGEEYSDTYYRYSSDFTPSAATSDLEDLDYTQPPSNTAPGLHTSSWFLHQLYFDILDDGIDHNSINSRTRILSPDPNSSIIRTAFDELYISNGSYLSPEPIFHELDGDLREVEDLRTELLSTWPSQANEINGLFDSYLDP